MDITNNKTPFLNRAELGPEVSVNGSETYVSQSRVTAPTILFIPNFCDPFTQPLSHETREKFHKRLSFSDSLPSRKFFLDSLRWLEGFVVGKVCESGDGEGVPFLKNLYETHLIF